MSDASASGIGAVIKNAAGSILGEYAANLSTVEQHKSSTFREVLALYKSLEAFKNLIVSAKIFLRIDNLGAVSVIK